nr:DUF5130 family protein [Actinoplanes lichenicola]
MTAGDLARQGGHDQPLTELEHPGGDSIVAHHGPSAADGPFTTRQLLRLDHALRIANTETGLTFSVFIGEFETPAREYAERLHRQIDGAAEAVLIAVSPNQRKLEIVTGNEARKRISDRDAKLAGLSMAAAFAGGDLAGGVVAGLDQLASHAGRS